MAFIELMFHQNKISNKYSIWGVVICFRNIILHISELEKIQKIGVNNNSACFNLSAICEVS